jgi:hypothetical protein
VKSSNVQRVVAVDWSGRVDASGQRKSIWMGVWTACADGSSSVTLQGGRTRREVVDELVSLSRQTKKMVVGVDFCFSYPAWFVEEVGAKSAREFWRIVSEQGEEWLGKNCPHDYFWGKPGKKNRLFLGAGSGLMFRRADHACKIRSEILDPDQRDKIKGIAPKSPFQTGGAGAVGTGSLRGIPELFQLSEGGFSVWPFDVPSLPMVVEIYPRLLTGEVKKSNEMARRQYLKRKQSEDAEYFGLDEQVIAVASSSEDAFDALVSVMEMAARRAGFRKLVQATDKVTLLEGAVWGAADLQDVELRERRQSVDLCG